MNKDKIALDFIKVYKRYKDGNFQSRKVAEKSVGEKLVKQNRRRKKRLDNINPED
jgi:hypothetical protein